MKTLSWFGARSFFDFVGGDGRSGRGLEFLDPLGSFSFGQAFAAGDAVRTGLAGLLLEPESSRGQSQQVFPRSGAMTYTAMKPFCLLVAASSPVAHFSG